MSIGALRGVLSSGNTIRHVSHLYRKGMTIIYLLIIAVAICVNLAVEVKFYLDIIETGLGVLDSRDRLLKFYDQTPVAEELVATEKNVLKETHKRFPQPA